MVVKLATAGLIEASRRNGKVPMREGFEYDQMVAPFLATGRTSAKLQVANMVEQVEIGKMVYEEDAPDVKRKKAKLLMTIMELQQKHEVDPDNWSNEDASQILIAQQEYDKLL